MLAYEDFIRGPEFFAFRDGRVLAFGVFAREFLLDPGARSGWKDNLVGEL